MGTSTTPSPKSAFCMDWRGWSVAWAGLYQGGESRRFHSQSHARLLLQHLKDREKTVRTRIAALAQHPMQALAGRPHFGRDRLEPDRGIDHIAEHGLSRRRVAAQIGVDRFGE